MKPRRLASVLALVVAAAAISVPASAAGVAPADANADQKARAQTAFERGTKLFQAKRYAPARKAFEESYDIVASPSSLFMIGCTYRDEGLPASAYEAFDKAERDAKPLASEDRYAKIVAESGKQRDLLKNRIGLLNLHVHGAGDDAKVTVGKRDIARDQWDKPVAVPTGSNLVQATAGVRKFSKWVTVAASASADVDVELGATDTAAAKSTVASAAQPPKDHAPASDPAPPSSASPVPAKAPSSTDASEGDEGPHRTSLLPIAAVAGAVGLLGFGTFAVAGWMNHSTYKRLQDECPSGCSVAQEGEIDTGKRQQLVANVGLVVGIVGAATFVGLVIVDAARSPGRSAHRTSLVIGPASAALHGQF